MDSKKISLFGVNFDNFTLDEAVEKALSVIDGGKGGYVCTPNPEIVFEAMDDSSFCDTLNSASIVLPDGIGIIYAAKILGTPLKGRLPGIDFASELISRLAKRGGSLFLFGSRAGTAEKAAEKIKEKYSGIRIVGCENGYFTDDTEIIRHINEASPDLLLVCLGAPKQEKWMWKNCGSLNARLMAGLGGALDVFSGDVKRAPELWQKLGLEWLYRLISEPRRIKRMIKLPLILVKAVQYRLGGKKHG